MSILTAEQHYVHRDNSGLQPALYPLKHVYTFWDGAKWIDKESLPLPVGDCDDPIVFAFVNHGRWLVRCPFGCGEAHVTSPEDKRFYCTTCLNRIVESKTIPVKWPTPKLLREIESLLVARPMNNQNWKPGETAADLASENTKYGVS